MRILIAAGMGLLALAGAPVPAAAATVSVYPAPGTVTAMPGTQISFRGAPPAQLRLDRGQRLAQRPPCGQAPAPFGRQRRELRTGPPLPRPASV